MRQVLAIFTLLLALTACRGEVQPTVDPANADAAEAACAADGGRWVPKANSGTMICLRTPADAGRRCETSGDCQGMCLARSNTCAPVMPLLGCNDVIGRSGAVSTVCVE